MKKFKKIIFISVILSSLIFLLAPADFPENFRFQQILDSTFPQEIIIIFNSGGWGNTPLEKAEDFTPIVKGIQETLNELGLNSIIAPYERTKDNFFGKITSVKEMRQSFRPQAEKLAEEIEEYLKQNSGKKIIITGLSNGGTFVNETMEKISEDLKNDVFAIEAGTPFWEKPLNSENVLSLDNEGRDPLSKGEMRILILTLIKAPFKWVWAKISSKNLTFSQAIYIPGHEYQWDKVSPEINSFLREKLNAF